MTHKFGSLTQLNPVALRMAKTLWSIGLSECNRIKIGDLLMQVWFKGPKKGGCSGQVTP